MMNNSQNVGWIVELTIKDGKFEAFEKLSQEMMASTKQESGTLQYEWNILEDNQSVLIIERYEDSVAALIHTSTFAEKFAERFDDIALQTRLFVYGIPNKALARLLEGAGGIFSQPIKYKRP